MPSLNSKLCHFELESIIAQDKNTYRISELYLTQKSCNHMPRLLYTEANTYIISGVYCCLLHNSRLLFGFDNLLSSILEKGQISSISILGSGEMMQPCHCPPEIRRGNGIWDIKQQGIKMGYNRNEFRCGMMTKVYLYCAPALS